MKHLKSLILLCGVLALSPLTESQAQTGSQGTGSSDTTDTGGDTRSRENNGSSDTTGTKSDTQNQKHKRSSDTKGTEHKTKNRIKAGDTGAKGRDSSGMGSESGTGGVPRLRY